LVSSVGYGTQSQVSVVDQSTVNTHSQWNWVVNNIHPDHHAIGWQPTTSTTTAPQHPHLFSSPQWNLETTMMAPHSFLPSFLSQLLLSLQHQHYDLPSSQHSSDGSIFLIFLYHHHSSSRQHQHSFLPAPVRQKKKGYLSFVHAAAV